MQPSCMRVLLPTVTIEVDGRWLCCTSGKAKHGIECLEQEDGQKGRRGLRESTLVLQLSLNSSGRSSNRETYSRSGYISLSIALQSVIKTRPLCVSITCTEVMQSQPRRTSVLRVSAPPQGVKAFTQGTCGPRTSFTEGRVCSTWGKGGKRGTQPERAAGLSWAC